MVRAIEALFVREDNEAPHVLDNVSRRALRETLDLAIRSEELFKKLRRARPRISRSYAVDYLCSCIEVGMSSFAEVRALGRIIRGVKLAHPRSGSTGFAKMFAEHAALFRKLRSKELDFASRLSVVLSMNQIELIFFAHMW